jgi:hypothetical protein
LEEVDRKIVDIGEEIKAFEDVLSKVDANAKMRLTQQDIDLVKKRDVVLASRLENVYNDTMNAFDPIVVNFEAVIKMLNAEKEQAIKERESMMIESEIVRVTVIMFIDKDFVNIDTDRREGTMVFSRVQDPAFDLIAVLGGATGEKEMKVGYSTYRTTVSVQCHDLGFPFSVRAELSFEMFNDQGNYSGGGGFISTSEWKKTIPSFECRFIIMRKDVDTAVSILDKLLDTTGMQLAKFGVKEFSGYVHSGYHGEFGKSTKMLREGAFYVVRRVSRSDSEDYREAFSRVMSGGKCKVNDG